MAVNGLCAKEGWLQPTIFSSVLLVCENPASHSGKHRSELEDKATGVQVSVFWDGLPPGPPR